MVRNLAEKRSATGVAPTPRDESTLDQGEMYKAFVPYIEKATKLSHEAMKDYRAAGARAVFYAVTWGDCSLMNKLWNGFHPSMQLSMRTGFIASVNAKYRVDGVQGKDEAGEEIWIKRPTPLFRFTAEPKNKNGASTSDHFSFTKPGDDEVIKSAITRMKDLIREDGISGLESLEWTTPEQAKTLGAAFDNKAFNKRLEKLLLTAAKSKSIQFPKSHLLAIARVAGVEGLDKQIEATFDAREKAANDKGEEKPEIIKPDRNNTTENVQAA